MRCRYGWHLIGCCSTAKTEVAWCASGCVVECRICNGEVADSNLSLSYFVPRSTQLSIPSGSVNEYQLRLGRQRQVWLIPIAAERVGVQVKLWNPLRTRAIPERSCGGDSLRRGAISSVCTFTFTLLWCSSARRQHQIPAGPVRIGNTSVLPVSAVRDLGIYIDADLTMSTHACLYNRWGLLRSTPADTKRAAFPDMWCSANHASCTGDHQRWLLLFSVDWCMVHCCNVFSPCWTLPLDLSSQRGGQNTQLHFSVN